MSDSQTPEPNGADNTLRTIRTTRNPRRRQRNDSDSVRTAPRRKRSKLTETQFVSRGEEEGDVEGGAPMNGHAFASGSSKLRRNSTLNGGLTGGHSALSGGVSAIDTEIVVRGGKKGPTKRATRGDGAQLLTENEIYTVKSLPSTPRELKRSGQEFRGYLATATGQALAVTREHAFVWDYGSHAPVSNAKVFDVPFPADRFEPLPFGALVTGGLNADTGLVLVSATTGKVVFHESVERAASMGLFQERRPGVEGSLGGLFSGEHVVDISSAESAGFIVTLSSGRIAQLTLRDMQGKARIQAQFLRENAQERSSWTATFKGLLGAGAWKVDVAAVHTRSLGPRGQMQAVALTEHGVCKVWDLDWSGRAEHRGSVDFKEEFVKELRAAQAPEMHGYIDPVTVMDFAFLDRPGDAESQELATRTPATEKPVDLLVLVRTGPADLQRFFLVETSLAGNTSAVKQVISIAPGPANNATSAPPKLVLPKPCHTAYVVFESSIVIAATTQPEDANAQLHDASYVAPDSFKDVVYLRQNKGLGFLGAEAEETRSGHAACIAFVRGAGLVRFSARDAYVDHVASIPVKRKIEQAVFFGILHDNILDLAQYDVKQDSIEEDEHAALAISDEVLRSKTPFIPSEPTSIEANLAYRAQALNALAMHLRQNYPTLSKKTLWQLLWDAEKVLAGQRLWRAFENHLVVASKGKKKSTLLHEISQWLQSTHPYAKDDASHDDRVRAMFIKRLANIEKFLPWASQIVASIHEEGRKSQEDILRLVAEAHDIWIGTLEAAFSFRTENAALYDIRPDAMREGVLVESTDYQELPEFWTSSEAIVKEILKLIPISREAAEMGYDNVEAEVCSAYSGRLAAEAPTLVLLTCRVFQERINWVRSRGGQKYQEKADQIQAVYLSERYSIIRSLAGVGQTAEALRISEKYRDMKTLTDVMVGESQYLQESLATATGEEMRVIKAQETELNNRVAAYFDRYGDEWSNAFFDEGFSGEQAGSMLGQGQGHYTQYLTRYLRADPSRAKICWINDVTLEKDFGAASKSLMCAAQEQESNVWCQKVQFSLAKLSMLAAAEPTQAVITAGHETTHVDPRASRAASRALAVIDVQERLYAHVLPEVLRALDIQAEVDLAITAFGKSAGQTAYMVLELGLAKLLQHGALSVDELVDVLTLMDRPARPAGVDEGGIKAGEEFYEALLALDRAAPELQQGRFDTLLRLLWKRAYLATDWASLHRGISKRSEADTAALLSSTPLYTILLAGARAGLLDPAHPAQAAEDHFVRLLGPAECMSAGTEAWEYTSRPDFPGDFVGPLAHEEGIAGRKLEALVRDHAVEGFSDDVARLVRVAWENEVEDRVRRESGEGLEDSVVMLDGAEVNGNGGINGGPINGFGHAVDGVIKLEDDEDGDVLME